MIASRLKKENPLWNYTGQQCEDKFKDLRKHYIKARDQNEKSSGLPVATCKFYKEMDDVLGDKPAVKPVCIAPTLKNVINLIPRTLQAQLLQLYTVIVKMTVIVVMIVPLNLKRKRKVLLKEISKDYLLLEQRNLKKRKRLNRHIERMQRQDHAIEIYQSAMNRLLEKL
ncbi:uncharacterized protein LOC112590439 [Harpegnathos saltator]|uniref:uncharacterized protein LOC112590439 n=1 Tax=Harpegnathos saltator TaxID=610380 RepID=UPI000DBEDE18|nr:uncharacterized protein LOC112590439 [Harpegnathos saltator]